MTISKQAITLDSTGSVLRYGRSPLVAGSGETLHIMDSLDPPNTDHNIFWKVVSNEFAAMTSGEKDAAIAWYKESKMYDIGDSGASCTIDWKNGSEQKITATDDTNITMTTTEDCINGELPCIVPDVKILKVINTGSIRTFTWPSNVYWPNGDPDIPVDTFYFKFVRFLGDYIGDRFLS